MSILGWIAFCLGAVVIVVGVIGITRVDKNAERRILEDRETKKETEALVHRLVYGEDGENSASNPRGTPT